MGIGVLSDGAPIVTWTQAEITLQAGATGALNRRVIMDHSPLVEKKTTTISSEETAARAVRDFLFARTNYERQPALSGNRAKVFKLARMRELLDRLGNPDRSYPIIHITGTKGKGSTATLAGAILTASGRRVGIFTSPHLEHVEERLAIDGLPCSPSRFDQLLEEIVPIVRTMDAEGAERGESGPTYFEMLTAMAFLYFAQEKVDAAVVEVGLGGRLDSTNVCHPEVCVITTISHDHMDLLGNSLEQIAWEKAGIIKRRLPVVSGVTQPGPRDVIRRVCQKRGCRLWELDRDFGVSYRPPRHLERDTALGDVGFWFQQGEGNGQREWREGQLRLLGSHQAANAAVAIMAVRCFQDRVGWHVSDQAVQVAIRETTVPARVEVLGRCPVVILDVAHNPASTQALVATLRECFDVRRRYLVFGTTQGKDYRGMLEVLAPHFDHIFLTQYTCNPRALPVEVLAHAAADLIPKRFDVFSHPAEAWENGWRRLTSEDLVCVTGSFFLAAEMQPILREHGMMSAQTFPRHSQQSR